ncbi:STAS domain-containing protein [Oceanibacterium hippocampi]|uniref:STAS/SEC14 domain-containing protein n=1 Tax=Oceanibacterium hippocampi TaxID=745714 RepID=A0A1Y5U2L5_9PROT|nr:STAS domain-containing protein [Oceanibacterium hippocampi]SLN77398.1 hypothetical protein OCH7691_04400 [Oceanibacterium hippocampi]
MPGRITVSTEHREHIMVIAMTGEIVEEDIVYAIRTNYPKARNLDVIWDMSGASVSGIETEGFHRIARLARRITGRRSGRRTVHVGSGFAPALYRMYGAIAHSAGLGAEYRVFETVEDARGWLLSERAAGHRPRAATG